MSTEQPRELLTHREAKFADHLEQALAVVDDMRALIQSTPKPDGHVARIERSAILRRATVTLRSGERFVTAVPRPDQVKP